MRTIRTYRLSGEELERLGVQGWDIWEKGASRSEWSYTAEEHCYVERGRARIVHNGTAVVIREGDYVVFPVGLTCTWEVDGPLKLRYAFRCPGSGSS